jgi:hypothetical protein
MDVSMFQVFDILESSVDGPSSEPLFIVFGRNAEGKECQLHIRDVPFYMYMGLPSDKTWTQHDGDRFADQLNTLLLMIRKGKWN